MAEIEDGDELSPAETWRQIQDRLIMLQDSRGRYIFPKDKFYWQLFWKEIEKFDEIYGWTNRPMIRLYKHIKVDMDITVDDLRRLGIKDEFINRVLSDAESMILGKGLAPKDLG